MGKKKVKAKAKQTYASIAAYLTSKGFTMETSLGEYVKDYVLNGEKAASIIYSCSVHETDAPASIINAFKTEVEKGKRVSMCGGCVYEKSVEKAFNLPHRDNRSKMEFMMVYNPDKGK